MKRRTSDHSRQNLMIGFNTFLFAVGALLVGYNTYLGNQPAAASSASVFGGLTVNDAMMISSFAIMLAGFFYSLAILKPDMLKRHRESKLMTLKVKAAQHEDFTDRFTELHNRAYFVQVLENYLDEYNALDMTLGVLIINVSAGREYRTKALKAAVNAICETVRDYDVIARYSDNQIAVLTPDIHKNDLVAISSRFRTTLANAKGMPFFASSAFGFATNTKKAKSAEEILAAAEEHLQLNRRQAVVELGRVA